MTERVVPMKLAKREMRWWEHFEAARNEVHSREATLKAQGAKIPEAV